MSSEAQVLQDALSADSRIVNIRLREGEYQYDLAKAIASFQLELSFPDVKDIIKRLYGEERANDIQFIRKIQTILKKMERSSIVAILSKKKPWDLQRYALSSFKFQDVDKNLVVFATEEQTKQAQYLLVSSPDKAGQLASSSFSKTKILILLSAVIATYAASLWILTLPVIEPLLFVPVFSVATVCSVLLGECFRRDGS